MAEEDAWGFDDGAAESTPGAPSAAAVSLLFNQIYNSLAIVPFPMSIY